MASGSSVEVNTAIFDSPSGGKVISGVCDVVGTGYKDASF